MFNPIETSVFSVLAVGGGGGGMAQALLPLVAIGVLFYFLLIRPERRKRSQMEFMLSQLKKNDRIVTIGGILGRVTNVQKDSDEVTINVDDNTNTKLRVLRSSIARVLSDDDGGKKEAT